MTILIHIGPPKTGTSAIQKSLQLAENNNYLGSKNIKYLNNKISNNDILFFIAQINSEPAREYKQSYSLKLNKYKKNSSQYLENLIKQNQKKFSLYISSSEYLFRINKDEIIKLKNNLVKLDKDIRVVSFIRDPIKQYISQFSENIKNSTKLTLPIETNQYQQLLIWSEIFNDKFYVYDFEKYIKSGNILFKFNDIINDIQKENNQSEIKLKTKILENESISAELAYAVLKFRKINNLVDSKYYEYLNRARKTISKITKDCKLTKLNLTTESENEFIKNNSKLYDLLDKKYNFEFKYNTHRSFDLNKKPQNDFNNFDLIIDNYDKRIANLIFNFLKNEAKGFKNPNNIIKRYILLFLRNFLKNIYHAFIKFSFFKS